MTETLAFFETSSRSAAALAEKYLAVWNEPDASETEFIDGKGMVMTTTGSGDGAMRVRTTREVLDLYNDAFRLHDPGLLEDLVADDCVIEDTGPAPDGVRREGGQACLTRWSELAGNRALRFTPEAADIHGDLAVQPWVLHWGDGEQDRIRGVNLIRIRDGRIVEARGYVKA